MRTRNTETLKSGTKKKTPVRKSAGKTPPKPSEAEPESSTPTSTETPSVTGPKPSMNSSAAATPNSVSKLESKVEDAGESVDAARTTPETKAAPAAKSSVKKTPGKTKTPTAAKAASTMTPKSVKVEESSGQKEEVVVSVEEGVKEEPKEQPKGAGDSKEPKSDPVNLEEDWQENVDGKDVEHEENKHGADEGIEDFGEQGGFEEPEDEECAEDAVLGSDEEARGLEDEQMDISALVKERKTKKEQEIFVGGLDRDAVEEDVKKAFEKIGEVVEVRLHRNPLTNKNKGYAFVKFADKEQATRALSELKNPVIRGKRCGVAPSEDNDTLFLGNICNTWTKEAIKQKLKEYGVESVENITLVPDARHEGLSRGFTFLEFSCHSDAMLAYKRLQKPDVIFGHAEWTAKVAFAEPLNEPDPEIMAQVKSVFVDGLPPHWDEDQVTEHFKGYGEIERIVLARNMSTAKRKDFGFVDFSTHEAAVACIDGVNNTELGEGKSKTRVKARLSNPSPKTQAIKGGMRGGFRIGHSGSGTFSRFGRGFGWGGRPFNRANFQHDKSFYPRGRGRTGRFGFTDGGDLGNSYSDFRGRRPFGFAGPGGRRGTFRGTHQVAATSSRPDWTRHGVLERGRGKQIQSRRQPFSPEGDFNGPFGARHFVDDPYLYDSGHGIKRPFTMMDQEPVYMEPSRLRPRYDHSDPTVSSRGNRYQDSLGTGGGLYSHDYYGSDYGAGAYSSLYGGDHSFGGGYYY